MKNNKTRILSLLAATAATVAVAQQPVNTYFLQALPQTYNMNPGNMVEGTGYMGFPLLGQTNVSFGNTAFAFSDMFKSTTIDGAPGVDIMLDEALLENFKDKNYLNIGLSKDLIGFGFTTKKKKNYFSINVTGKFLADVTYSKDLFSFLLQGNAADEFSDGSPISLDGTGFNVTAYTEYGFGYSRKVNEKLNIGGRIKLLQGYMNAYGNFDGISITTAKDLSSITLNSSLSINTSMPDSAAIANNQISAMGSGYALDLGGSYKVNDKISAYVSFADLGQIKWNDSSKRLYNDGASFSFTGLTTDQLNDTTFMNNLTDSIGDIFELKKDSGSYKTNLPTRLFVGGKYQLNKIFSADALYSVKWANGNPYHTGVVGVGVKAKKWFEGRLSYGVLNGAWNQIGFASVINLGALQLYFVTDNIAGLFAVDYTKSLSASVGANFTFGRMESKADKAKKAKEKAAQEKKAAAAAPAVEPTPAPAETTPAPAETTPSTSPSESVAPVEGTTPAPSEGTTPAPTEGTTPAEGTQEAIPAGTTAPAEGSVAPAEGTSAPATTPAGDIQGVPVTE